MSFVNVKFAWNKLAICYWLTGGGGGDYFSVVGVL